jgi:hypothetical protein
VLHDLASCAQPGDGPIQIGQELRDVLGLGSGIRQALGGQPGIVQACADSVPEG